MIKYCKEIDGMRVAFINEAERERIEWLVMRAGYTIDKVEGEGEGDAYYILDEGDAYLVGNYNHNTSVITIPHLEEVITMWEAKRFGLPEAEEVYSYPKSKWTEVKNDDGSVLIRPKKKIKVWTEYYIDNKGELQSEMYRSKEDLNTYKAGGPEFPLNKLIKVVVEEFYI